MYTCYTKAQICAQRTGRDLEVADIEATSPTLVTDLVLLPTPPASPQIHVKKPLVRNVAYVWKRPTKICP